MIDRDTGRQIVITDFIHPGEYGVLARGFNGWVICRGCKQKCHLANYVILPNGTVTPTFACPKCKWQGNLSLEGYTAPEELPAVAIN